MVNMLVTYAKMKGFGLNPLFGDRRDCMPPQLKTYTELSETFNSAKVFNHQMK